MLAALGNAQAAMSEETLKEKHANVTGQTLEPPSRRKKSNCKSKSSQYFYRYTKPNPNIPKKIIINPGEAAQQNSLFSGSTRAGSGLNQGKKGMVLPFLPLSITFDSIRYSVNMPQVSSAYVCHNVAQTYLVNNARMKCAGNERARCDR